MVVAVEKLSGLEPATPDRFYVGAGGGAQEAGRSGCLRDADH